MEYSKRFSEHACGMLTIMALPKDWRLLYIYETAAKIDGY